MTAEELETLLDQRGKIYYTTSEVAAMLQLSSSLLRYWEGEFEMIKPRKNKKGDRQYRREDILIIHHIHQLVKVQGMTIKGANDYLKNHKPSKREQLIAQMEELKGFLIALKNELTVPAS